MRGTDYEILWLCANFLIVTTGDLLAYLWAKQGNGPMTHSFEQSRRRRLKTLVNNGILSSMRYKGEKQQCYSLTALGLSMVNAQSEKQYTQKKIPKNLTFVKHQRLAAGASIATLVAGFQRKQIIHCQRVNEKISLGGKNFLMPDVTLLLEYPNGEDICFIESDNATEGVIFFRDHKLLHYLFLVEQGWEFKLLIVAPTTLRSLQLKKVTKECLDLFGNQQFKKQVLFSAPENFKQYDYSSGWGDVTTSDFDRGIFT